MRWAEAALWLLLGMISGAVLILVLAYDCTQTVERDASGRMISGALTCVEKGRSEVN